ncbi:putative molybdenum carrier protein [Caenispirillum bisanense]|uniref:Molybdenum carrier n=1 Tax=Caenispirillum bisanense TaxID=414052 RepID=A0A286GGI0_9PROT|nr:putative molybdenum carrier protein [Caenispirillum bisanense]SOD94608.1 Putative molybdenum carrier [Caenispirillum bisanense]
MARIVCGGQTGADRAALDYAILAGIPYGGWCPRDGWAEDRPAFPGLLADYPALIATPSADPAQRTEWNARDSDITAILVPSRGFAASPGTTLTEEAARRAGKPVRVFDVSDPAAVTDFRDWVRLQPEPPTLNIAGPRESEAPGLQARVLAFLVRALG